MRPEREVKNAGPVYFVTHPLNTSETDSWEINMQSARGSSLELG